MIKSILKWKGVKLVFVTGKNSTETADFIFDLIQDFLKVKRVEPTDRGMNRLLFIFYDVIIVTREGNNQKTEDLFSNFREVITVVNSENITDEKEVIQTMKKSDTLLVDFESKEKFSGKRMKYFLSFGFDSEADFNISDMNIHDKKTNFKLNYDGSSVPVWIPGKKTEDDVLQVVASLGVGVLLNINFVSLTQKIKN